MWLHKLFDALTRRRNTSVRAGHTIPLKTTSPLKGFSLPRFSGHYAMWRVTSIIVVGLMAGGTLMVSYFIYQHIYTTISNTNAIVVLNSNLNIQTVDVDAFSRTQELITKKMTKVTVTRDFRNIFSYGKAPTSTPVTSTPNL